MNKDIKFRAWNGKKMRYNISLNFCQKKKSCEAVREGYQWFNKGNDVLKSEIMQFTGLKDKNGVDIYEGDILSDGSYVVFDNGSFKSTYKGDTQNGSILNAKRLQHNQIIGNIYENKELLENG